MPSLVAMRATIYSKKEQLGLQICGKPVIVLLPKDGAHLTLLLHGSQCNFYKTSADSQAYKHDLSKVPETTKQSGVYNHKKANTWIDTDQVACTDLTHWQPAKARTV